MLTVKELVIRARSARAFDESEKINRSILSQIVDCARLCPSAMNLQPLKYKLITDKEGIEKVISLTSWGGYIKDRVKLPPDGAHPTGYIIVCHDKKISELTKLAYIDAGIAAQTINLAARDQGFAVCMFTSFEAEKLKAEISLAGCEPLIVIALGVSAEKDVLCTTSESPCGIKYFRNANGVHFVPKRPLDEVVID